MDVFRNGRNTLDTCYAGKKRRRPAKRTTIAADTNSKSNPSKRHRERLNAELEKLAQLLPFNEDTIARLDKLSILRLCVSYLRNKSFFQVALENTESNTNGVISSSRGGCQSTPMIKCLDESPSEMPSSSTSDIHLDKETEMLLQALNGFIVVVEPDGEIFYTSPSISDFLGFQNVDVMHQNVFELIHKDDRVDFQDQLVLKPLSPEDPEKAQLSDVETSLERNFFCRFRCLLDESSGFLNLHFTGKLRPMYGQRTRGEDGIPADIDPPKLGLFALACPMQQPAIMEIYVRNMIFRTKHRLDFRPQSLDSKGVDILGFSEEDLSSMNGYNYLHYEDIIYCSEMHSQLMRKGETRFIYFRLMTKRSKWLWVQAKGRVIYKNGKPDALVSTHRPMSDEEGEQYLANRGAPFKFPFEGPAELYSCNPPLPPIPKEILQGMSMGGGGPPLGSPGGPPMGGPPMGGPPMGAPPMGGPPMSGPPMGGPPMSGPHMGQRMSGPPRCSPSVDLLPSDGVRVNIPRNSPPNMVSSSQPLTNGMVNNANRELSASNSIVRTNGNPFMQSYSPPGHDSQHFSHKMPIPEPAMVQNLMNKDLAEALQNIHFENTLENISNSEWSKDYERKLRVAPTDRSGTTLVQEPPPPTLKYSPGSSPQCAMEQRCNPPPQNNNHKMVSSMTVTHHRNSEVSLNLKSEVSFYSSRNDSGVACNEADSNIHLIEADLIHLEAQLAQGPGRGSHESIESAFDIPGLDIGEFEGNEIDLEDVLNMIEGVDTSTPDLNLQSGERLVSQRSTNGYMRQEDNPVQSVYSQKETPNILKAERSSVVKVGMQTAPQSRYQNSFPQRQLEEKMVLTAKRRVPTNNEQHVDNGQRATYSNVPAVRECKSLYRVTSTTHHHHHQGSELCPPTADAPTTPQQVYQNHSTTAHSSPPQGYFTQYSQPASHQMQEPTYFQRSQQMQQTAQQSQMFSLQQNYLTPSSQEAVISPVRNNILPNIEEQYKSTINFQQNGYSHCFNGLQNSQFPTLQDHIPWEENDNQPNHYINMAVNYTEQ